FGSTACQIGRTFGPPGRTAFPAPSQCHARSLLYAVAVGACPRASASDQHADSRRRHCDGLYLAFLLRPELSAVVWPSALGGAPHDILALDCRSPLTRLRPAKRLVGVRRW